MGTSSTLYGLFGDHGPVLRDIQDRDDAVLAQFEKEAATRSAKPTLDFYGSAAWKAIRLEVQRDCRRTCQRCGKTDTRIYVDHIVELKDGGTPLERSNLMGLCASCHAKKSARERAKRMGHG